MGYKRHQVRFRASRQPILDHLATQSRTPMRRLRHHGGHTRRIPPHGREPYPAPPDDTGSIAGNETMPDARHNTILPFTRFLCGPADYTPCYFNARVKNTHAHQLAMPVVYYSPVTFLYWYDTPSLYQGEKNWNFGKRTTTWTRPTDRRRTGEYIAWHDAAERNGSWA